MKQLPPRGRGTAPRSRGAVLLSRTCAPQVEIAQRIGVSRPLAGHWITGARVPSKPEHLAALLEAYGIPVESWREPAVESVPPPPRSPRELRIETPPPPAEELTVRARAVQLTKMVQTTLLQDLPSCHTPLERARVLNAATVTLTHLGRLTGEAQDMPEDRVIRLPAFRRAAEALVEALRPWPDAMRAAGECLVALSSEK